MRLTTRILGALLGAGLLAATQVGGCPGHVRHGTPSSSSTLSVLAGDLGGLGNADGTGSAARFRYPQGIATDGTSLFIADQQNSTVRQIVIATGVVTTLAGLPENTGSTDGTGSAARFSFPTDVATDGTNVYVVDNNNFTIRKIVIATGVVTTLAGNSGVSGFADGTGTAAEFNYPNGITTDGANLFVTDTGSHTIRQVVIATGVVTTLAGTPGFTGSADGTGASALFNYPAYLTTDGTNLYVSDTSNHTIRKVVIATGVVTTLAGTAGSSGSANGTGAAARFYNPQGVASDGTNLFVGDASNLTIRQIVIATGVVTTLAGTAGSSGSADGTGSAARFYTPYDVDTDGTLVYVCDGSNGTIRRIVIATGEVTTPAGRAEQYGSTDGSGTSARFYYPSGADTDGTNLFVADSYNHTIRQVAVSSGAVTTLAGSATLSGSTDGTGAAARFNFPYGVSTDGTNVYVADTSNHTLRKVIVATGVVTTLAGSAGIPGSTNGTGSSARFNGPAALANDGTNLFVADYNSSTVRQVVISSGVVTTLAGSAGLTGSTDGTGSAARFNSPYGLATDGTNVFVADTGNQTIRKIVIATGVVTTLAGSAGVTGTADGTGSAARFFNPLGIATDGSNLFVADSANHTVRKLVIGTGVVTTPYGVAGQAGVAPGSLPASLNGPYGVSWSAGRIYIVDNTEHSILTAPTP